MQSDIEISPHGSLLVYKKEYSADDVKCIIKQHNLRGLRIFSVLKEDRLQDLTFLGEFTFLEALDIVSMEDFDLGFLRHLVNLKSLGINVQGQNLIDLSWQTELESLTILWRKDKVKGLEKCTKLKKLCLIEYKEENLKSIECLQSLEDLKIKTATIRNCQGIEKLAALKSLDLGACRRLTDIGAVGLLSELINISFDMCSKVRDFSPLAGNESLEVLRIVDCKAVDSIRFVVSLPSLRKLSLLGNSDVLDGDLIPAKGIRDVFYRPRAHYNIVIENKEADLIRIRNQEKLKEIFNNFNKGR